MTFPHILRGLLHIWPGISLWPFGLGQLAKAWDHQSAHNDEWMTSRKTRAAYRKGKCRGASLFLQRALLARLCPDIPQPFSGPEDRDPLELADKVVSQIGSKEGRRLGSSYHG